MTWIKPKENNISWKLWEIQISVFISKGLLEYSHVHLDVLPMASFMLQWQIWAFAIEIVCSTKLQTFPAWPFSEKRKSALDIEKTKLKPKFGYLKELIH